MPRPPLQLLARGTPGLRPPRPAHAARFVCSQCVRRSTRRRQQQPAGAAAGGSGALRGQAAARRGLATQATEPGAHGPLAEYDERVHSRRLRDDEHQRNIVHYLQDLHEVLQTYRQPAVVRPSVQSLQPPSRFSLGRLLGKAEAAGPQAADALPKGLYMHGDVGSGKTMLMDLFYETLPPNIAAKTRIHFHNFMQDVHRRMHATKRAHGDQIDAIALVAAEIAEASSVLCFDEFQCTDVADAMILRRLIEALMAHGVVIVTTSNRHPSQLYLNGIQRQSFIPCIDLLLTRLRVLNLDSPTDYRKIPRPPSGVYHTPLDADADAHADRWFLFFGDAKDPPHPAEHEVWGRKVRVPRVSGRAARFDFWELMGRATGAADYLELVKWYDAFVVTGVPAMTYRERDLARRFITFIDAVYESRAKIVLTTAVPLARLFLSPTDLKDALKAAGAEAEADADVDSAARMMMDDLGMNMKAMQASGLFSGDEERFAFSRALSRLAEMGSREWVERGTSSHAESEAQRKARSRWREDNM